MKEQKGILSPGWKTAIAGTIMVMTMAGSYFSFGVFVPYLLEDFGWSRTEISGAASLRAVVTGLLTPLVGILVDRHGTRKIAPFSVLFVGLGYLSLYWTEKLWQLYLGVGLLLGAGLSASYIPVVALLLRLFKGRSALPVGLLDSGRGMGQIFFSPFLAYMIATFDWRLTFASLAFLVGTITVPFLFWIAPEPGTPGLRERKGETVASPVADQRSYSLREALKMAGFWVVLLVYFLNSFGFQMVLFHIVAYAIDSEVSESAAAFTITVIGIFSVIGALLAGVLSRRIDNRLCLWVGLSIQVPALLLLTTAETATSFYIPVAIFALGFGAVFPLMPAIMGELFGTRAAGGLIGALGIAFTAGILSGPLFAGYIFDVTQSYSSAFISTASAIFVLLLLLVPFRAYQRKSSRQDA